MSSDNKQNSGDEVYCTPSFAADLFATLVGLALVYGMIALVGNASAPNQAHAASKTIELTQIRSKARGKLAAFLVYKTPKPLPAFTYVDEQGRDHTLDELRGKVVLLNLWATWCGPCRHEMPWLDSLKEKYKDQPFEMLTISIDRGGLKKPRRFFNKIKVRHLTLYGAKTARLAPKLRAFGMPTTLLIGPDGKELGRIAGPAEWASDDAHAFIEAAIASAKILQN